MPPSSRRKEFWNSVTSRLDAVLPSRDSNKSPCSVPAASSGHLDSSRHPTGVHSETDIADNVSATNTDPGQRLPTSPPTLDSTVTTGEDAPLFRRSNAAAGAFQPASQCTGPNDWVGLKALLRVINQSASLFGPLKIAVDELVECIGIYERVANGRDEFNTLRTELESIFEDLKQHFSCDGPPTFTASMESLCNSIVKELGYVKGKQGRSAPRRCLEAGEDADAVLACYRRIQGHLQRLSLNTNLSVGRIVDEQATNARLDRLSPSFSACYNSKQATQLKRGACTPGTRIEVLGQTHNWVHNCAAGPVYWLNGMAGTGKTTIAYSLCKELDAAHNLGASFFCSRALPECRDVDQIIPSIAYQLAHFSRPFRCALSRVLERERNVHTQLLHIQFEALVVKPLVEVRETLPEDLVVVVDALDECENKESTSQILEAFLTRTSDLPIKFFITSRPEPEIRHQMGKQGDHQATSRLVLHELDTDTVQGDIETYLKTALKQINPSESQIATLVQRAGILFIYAATVVRYIGFKSFSRNPRSRLDKILDISSSTGNHTHEEIDELYAAILEAAVGDPMLTPQEKDDMKQVLNTVLCAREPLTIRALSGLLGLNDIDRVHAALEPLWSVLHVVESSELVTALHASFPDYIFNPERSRDYFCDPVAHEQLLARLCFNRIKNAEPQFNICGLESSYVADDQVANLGTRVENAISPELFYACRYWATHLESASESADLVELLEDFLSARLLLWMEIMNLKKCMDVGVGILRQAEQWCGRDTCSEELRLLALDAWRFVTVFASSPISQSTPHIYVSMLPFWPESHSTSKSFAKRAQGMVPQGSAIARRRLESLATWSADRAVYGVIWSPDGKRIASATGKEIFLQDAVTGRIVLSLLQRKSSRVESLGFSPNGNLIVVGSADGTLSTWDAQSGQMVLGPFEGHTESLTSVAFSPDGTRIASASCDETIRMWDAQNGRAVLGPLEGHTNWVTTVAFSPDGTCIVSGSWDKTLRLWDTRSGQTVLDPLEGHTDLVVSVAFSPDGAHIVSGSRDRTIRFWDAQSGQMTLGPLKGHADLVTSVAFSPDGQYIVSSSGDKTIRLWDSHKGQVAYGPLEGHTSLINSVAFSPDGTRIASSSHDKTIRVWDARRPQQMPEPCEAHAESINTPNWYSSAPSSHCNPTRVMRSTPALHQVLVSPENSTESTNTLNWISPVFSSHSEPIRVMRSPPPPQPELGSLGNIRETATSSIGY